jgi:hypothetical protein
MIVHVQLRETVLFHGSMFGNNEMKILSVRKENIPQRGCSTPVFQVMVSYTSAKQTEELHANMLEPRHACKTAITHV